MFFFFFFLSFCLLWDVVCGWRLWCSPECKPSNQNLKHHEVILSKQSLLRVNLFPQLGLKKSIKRKGSNNPNGQRKFKHKQQWQKKLWRKSFALILITFVIIYDVKLCIVLEQKRQKTNEYCFIILWWRWLESRHFTPIETTGGNILKFWLSSDQKSWN